MSEALEVARLTSAEARALTDEVKADAAALWGKLLSLYEGGAHLSLGYPSWGAYYEAEFSESGRRGYQILEAARVAAALEPVNHGSTGPSERVARELAPVLHEAPEQVEEVWAEIVEEHGPSPTAAQVRQHVAPRAQQSQERVVNGIVSKARLIVELEPHLNYEVVQTMKVSEEWTQQLAAARTILSRLLGAAR